MPVRSKSIDHSPDKNARYRERFSDDSLISYKCGIGKRGLH